MNSELKMERDLPTKDTIYIIPYTRETSEIPKGAMLSHESLVSGLSNIEYLG